MSNTNVPSKRAPVNTADFKSGRPVKGSTWASLGKLANYCNGHGGFVVPYCAPDVAVTQGNQQAFQFKCLPKAAAVERIWYVVLEADSGSTSEIRVNLTFPTGTLQVIIPPSGKKLITYVENVTAKATSETTLQIIVRVDSTGDTVYLRSVCGFEMPRSYLEKDTTDYGVDVDTIDHGEPVYDAANVSMAGVVDAVKNMDARRVSLFQFASVADTAGEFYFKMLVPASTAWTNCFDLDMPVIPAVRTPTSSEATLTVRAYAKLTANTGSNYGHIRFQSTEYGATAVITVNTTAATHYSSTCIFKHEDLSTDDGIATAWSDWESVNIDARGDGSVTMTIMGLGVTRDTKPV